MPISLKCQNCGKEYKRKPCFAAKSKACSKQCLGVIQRTEHKGKLWAPHSPILWKSGPDNPMWRGGDENYDTKFVGQACERCSSTRRLLVHHIDENKRNHDHANLETLCRKCHQNHHAEPRRDPKTGRYSIRVLDHAP
jgi:hypothetical protein